jgi:hypothetical protein
MHLKSIAPSIHYPIIPEKKRKNNKKGKKKEK